MANFYWKIIELKRVDGDKILTFDVLTVTFKVWHFKVQGQYFDGLLLRNVITSTITVEVMTCLVTSLLRLLLELTLTVRSHQKWLLTVRVNFWQSKMRGKQYKLSEGESH